MTEPLSPAFVLDLKERMRDPSRDRRSCFDHEVRKLLDHIDALRQERDEVRGDLERVWQTANEELNHDAGMDAYTPQDAMKAIIGHARNEAEDELESLREERDRLREEVFEMHDRQAALRTVKRERDRLKARCERLRAVVQGALNGDGLDGCTCGEPSTPCPRCRALDALEPGDLDE